MPQTRLAELLTNTDRTPKDDFELSSQIQNMEGLLWELEALINNIKSSAVIFGHGKIVAGERNIQLSKTGLTMKSGSGTVNEIKFRKELNGTTRAYIRGFQDEVDDNSLTIAVDGTTSFLNQLKLNVFAATSDGVRIIIESNTSQVGSVDVNIFDSSTSFDVLTWLFDRVKYDVPIKLKERAASVTDDAAYGQLWVKDDNPNILRYTDGDGTEFIVDMTAV